MKRMILALAASAGLALFAVPVSADEPATPAKPGATVGAPVVVSESTVPARRGILARLRDRRNTGTMVTTPATVTPSTAAPSTVPSPMPMPGVKPASGTTTGSTVTTAAYTTTQPARTGLFSRIRNRGNSTMMVEPMPMPTTDKSKVVPASCTTTTTPAMETSTTTSRMGLMARLRARRTN